MKWRWLEHWGTWSWRCFLTLLNKKKNASFCCTDKPNALSEPRAEEESLTKKGKKKKSVRWAEEEQLKEYFYFDLDETERGKDGTFRLTDMYVFRRR